jgi:hypothetical protein
LYKKVPCAGLFHLAQAIVLPGYWVVPARDIADCFREISLSGATVRHCMQAANHQLGQCMAK